MELVKDVFLWSEGKGFIASKYEDNNIDIKQLANDLPSNRVSEHLDNCIDGIISLILSLKDELKTVEKVEEYIKAVLIITEDNTVLNDGK
jgi:hypothetical protein